MASKEVLSILEELHKELEKLEPAIKHIEAAQQVTSEVKKIPKIHLELLEKIKTEDNNHKIELEKTFRDETKTLSNENKRLQDVTSKIQESVINEQNELQTLLTAISSYYKRIDSIDFPLRFDGVDNEIISVKKRVEEIQVKLDAIEKNILNRIKKLDNDLFFDSKRTQKMVIIFGIIGILIETVI